MRAGDRRPVPAWVLLILLAIFAIGAVKFIGDALRLHAKDDADCPAVSDVNLGRGLDFKCSTYGGTSKDSAVLMLAFCGLAFGGVPVYVAVGAVRDMRRPGDTAARRDALADDTAEVDALRERGLLTDEERQTAIDRRLRAR